MFVLVPGADPEIKKGGGAYIYNGDWCSALASFPGLCAFVAGNTSLAVRRLQYVAQKPGNEATYRASQPTFKNPH